MAAAERRHGRRGNGLDAGGWRPIDDLDPRVSEDVLGALADQGIAAYVQPAVDVDPVTRSATLPDRPSDRLYVDRQRVLAARDCLRRFFDAGGRNPRAGSDLDATFAGIVAGFDRPVDPLAATWPTAESLAGPPATTEQLPVDPLAEPGPQPVDSSHPPPAVAEPQPAGPIDARAVTEPSLLDALDALDTVDTAAPDEDEPTEEFVPPPPPPLPRLSRQTVLGTLAVLAGLVMVIGQPDVLPLDRSSTIVLGFVAMLGGAAALILRLRPGTDPDDTHHPDDGAQV